MTTKISEANIQDATLETLLNSGGGGPKISSIIVTDSSYVNLDDTAVALEGGFVKLIGSGFAVGCQVLIGLTPATSVTFISDTEVRAQLPATAAGTYIVYLVNADGGTAIRVNAITFSSTPTWVTGSSLIGTVSYVISIQLSASLAATYSLQAGSSLPSGVSLSSSGLISGTVTDISSETVYNFTVLATDTELQDSPRSFALTISVAEPYFMYNTLLLAGNGTNNKNNNTFLDSSTNNFSITRNGNTNQGTFTPYGSRWSNYFDGNGDYLTVAENAALDFGTGDFTVEAWVYPINNGQYHPTFLGSITGWSAGASGHRFNNTNYANKFWFGLNGSGGIASGDPLMVSNNTFSFNTWHHYAITRTGNTFRMFVNGVLENTQTFTGSYNAGLGGLRSGWSTWDGANGYWTGSVSNLRLVKGTALYTANFTPSTTPLQAIAGTSLLICADNRFVDDSANNFAITQNGNVSVQRFSPFGPGTIYNTSAFSGSAYFDGSGDYLLNTGTTAGQLGSGNFTFECWYYPTNATFGTGGANTAAGIFFDCRATATDANGLSFYTMTNGTVSIYTNSDVIFTTSNALNAFAWNHIAFVRSGSTITGYINGVSGGTVTSSVNFSSGRLQISGPVDYSSGFIELVGYVSDHRIVKGTAVYTGTFTPPTEPLTAVANTSLLLNYTNAGIIDNTMQNNLETVGDAKISTAVSKFDGSSMYFNGTEDYCFIKNTQAFLFGSGNFTIELWAYLGDTSSRKYILGPGTDTDSHWDGFGVEIFGQQLCVWASSNGTSWDIIECDTAGNRGATLLSANTWYHIAVTRSGSTFRTFINGVVEKTYTSSAAVFSDASVPYNIGRTAYLSGTFYYNGYMDDLRVTRGYARYTSNFTPPAQVLIM